MDLNDDTRFRALRHRFYKLGEKGITVLQNMGALGEISEDIRVPKDEQRKLLFELAGQNRMDEIERAIEEEEKGKENE